MSSIVPNTIAVLISAHPFTVITCELLQNPTLLTTWIG